MRSIRRLAGQQNTADVYTYELHAKTRKLLLLHLGRIPYRTSLVYAKLRLLLAVPQHTISYSYVYDTITMRPFFAFRQKSLFITGRSSIGCQKLKIKKTIFCTLGMFV